MIHYKPMQIRIDISSLTEVIINMVIRDYGLLNSIGSDQKLVFIYKFWSMLCYFFSIKWRLSIFFYLKINRQIKRQNGIVKVYLGLFLNWEQNNLASFLPITKFTNNNVKKTSISYLPFIFDCEYNLHIFF